MSHLLLNNSERQCSTHLSSSNFTRRSGGAASLRKLVVSETSEDIFNYDNRDWIKTLEKLREGLSLYSSI